ncbi:MAG TPA: MerR family transcriptional regulator [Caulobacteraceae bacterium]|nr:MerR family transcriptional regulator [Caulobacteraceae bacterium]
MAADGDPTRYTARELAALCGASERTVRYYVGEGLLPPPASRGRGANFGADHLTRLRLIRAMQQAGNDLESIRDYLREMERELGRTGATFEAALTVWTARTEEAAWRAKLTKHWATPEVAHRYRIAEGIELLVDPRATPHPGRMREIVRLIRDAFAEEDGD